MAKRKPLNKWRKTFRKHYNKFVYCDGGRWKAILESGTALTTTVRLKSKNSDWLKSYARNNTSATSEKMREVGDCAIRATAVACGVPYAEVKRIARRHGWSKYRGWNAYGWFLSNHTVFGKSFQHISTWGRGKTTTTFQFLKKYPVGTYVLIVKDFSLKGTHTFVVKNGRVFDTFFEDCWVIEAFEVLDKSEAM